MKKILLLGVAISLFLSVLGQSGYKKLQHPNVNISVSVSPINYNEPIIEELDFKPQPSLVQSFTNRSANGIEESIVMSTQYDLQSNGSLGSRLIAWPDGTAAATATMGLTGSPSFADRGTGYNYYTGTAWGATPTARVEPFRSGWPSIAPLGENGEILVSHGGTPFGIHKYTRTTKGSGNWSDFELIANPVGKDLTWPRIATSAEDNSYIHLVAAYQDANNTLMNEVYYNRSFDGGATWEGYSFPPEVSLDFYNNNISADDYTIATNGDVVAILFASAWYDLFFIKSTDNGDTWEKTVIWEHPYPTIDFNTFTLTVDTLWTVDNSANITIDNNGMVHVVWGTSRVLIPEVTSPPGGYNFFPYTDGIGYWNESMGQIPTNPENFHRTMDPDYLESLNMGIVVGWVPDINGNDTLDIVGQIHAYRTLGLSTTPAIAIDENGSIAIVYSTLDEQRITTSDDEFHYKSGFATYKDGIYGSWYYAYENITGSFFHLFDEVYYTTMATKGYDGTFFAMYQADNKVGTALDEDHEYQNNNLWVAKLTPVVVGVNENVNPVTSISSAYPNPANNNVRFDLNLSKSVKYADVNIYSLTGQLIHSQTISTLNTGMNTTTIDVNHFNPGVYFCTFSFNGFKETKKFIVN